MAAPLWQRAGLVGATGPEADDPSRHQPHMGVAAWLATVAATLTAWLVALIMVIGATTDSIRTGAVVTLCLELFGFSEHTPWPDESVLLFSSR